MISGSSSCFSNGNHMTQMYPPAVVAAPESEDNVVSTSLEAASSSSELANSNSLLYSLSILKDKFNQMQSLVSIVVSPGHDHQQLQQRQNPESTSLAIANMGTIIQEIIVAASSIMFTCQQMAIGLNNNTNELHQLQPTPPPHANNKATMSTHQENALLLPNCQDHQRGQNSFFTSENFDWYDNNYNDNNNNNNQAASGMHNNDNDVINTKKVEIRKELSENFCQVLQEGNYDIIELDASYLLAKYTHYCQVCGKGFKRDANLRMHMRAHGDEYKTITALSNPMKIGATQSGNRDNSEDSSIMKLPRKYSCPQEGCRWNRKHARFQPLKSMICVKNHYKRSHCPKMYVCKRCNKKQFSVLSDLRTHEKHCGDVKWQCSCGTTFSRKDKLMGHVGLFVGHTPAVNSFDINPPKVENQQMQLDDS